MTEDLGETMNGESQLRPLRAILIAVIVVACAAASITWLMNLPGVPYNVRALFPARHRSLCVVGFSFLLLWIGFAPAWIGDYAAVRARRLPFLPYWAAMIGLVTFSALRFSVTLESAKDIIGGWSHTWMEDWIFVGRFIALQAVATLPLLVAIVGVGGAVRQGGRRGARLALLATLCVAPWLVLAVVVVGPWANTDNIVELIRTEPVPWIGAVAIVGLSALLAANAAALGYALARGRVTHRIGAVLSTAVLTVPGWALLHLGLNPQVHKYGKTFPAARFLLGPDRGTGLSWSELFLRWGALQVAIVALLACGCIVALCLRPRRLTTTDAENDRPEDPGNLPLLPRHPGRAYGWATGLYAIALIYGSLLPFRLQAISFSEAWDTFWSFEFLASAGWGESDMTLNTAAYIPLGFCALGALSRENASRAWWYMIPGVLAAGMLLSLGMEFAQIFESKRIPSGHDVIAQTIGNLMGLGLWIVFGTPISHWARRIAGRYDGRGLWIRILFIYAVLFVFLQLWPFDVRFSLSSIHGKHQQGMIRLIPFSDLSRVGVLSAVMEAGMYIPVGVLLALRIRAARHPIMIAIIEGLILACVLETVQLFVRSRFVSGTDAILGASAAGLGALLVGFLGRRNRDDVDDQGGNDVVVAGGR